jgi:hypothetical protein
MVKIVVWWTARTANACPWAFFKMTAQEEKV